MLISRKPSEIERFRRNVWSAGYLCRVAILILKNFCLTKNGGHFEFSNLSKKIAKHKNAYISKTVFR